MAEPLLDMCFEIFFKFEKMTLPLLPEVLALHQVGETDYGRDYCGRVLAESEGGVLSSWLLLFLLWRFNVVLCASVVLCRLVLSCLACCLFLPRCG